MKSWSGVLSRPISEACFRFFSFSWFRFFLAFDPENKQFLTYSSVTFGDFAISIAAGAAGVLAFTDGAPATLIGVAVALALLLALVSLGLLVVAGYFQLATGAFILTVTNIISINLAGVVTF